ncbi:MAG: protein kinase [Acidobacteria bacterium]|nr:protein kinase [Acidobacteriota bacterium]
MKELSPGDVERVKAIYARALSIAGGAEREQFLRTECGAEPKLLEEIRRLLGWHAAAGDFLNTPLPQQVVELGAEGGIVGGWRLLRRIGRGGSATVYLAQRADAPGEERAALKILNRLSHTAEDFRRFQQETRILAGLSHPGVVRFLEAGTTGEAVAYIATEFVDGKPLDEFVTGLALEEKVRLFCRICEVVEYAHGHRVVHRDLKPSNILVEGDGTPKILDFGIALLQDGDARLTLTGMERMSLPYASPEQVRREKEIGAGSDIYSMGVLLYEAIAGHLPYGGPEHALPLQIVADAPLPLRGVRQELEAIVQLAMAKEAGSRYASVADLRADLQAFADGGKVAALRPHGKRWLRRTWLTAGAALTVAGGAGVLVRRWTEPSTEVIDKNRAEELTGFHFSPDGRHLLYSAGSEFFQYGDVFLRDNATGKVRQVTRDGAPKWWSSMSPDGKWIAFQRGGGSEEDSILRVPTEGGEEKVLARGPFRHFTWGYDASRMVVSHRSDTGIWPHLRGYDLRSGQSWEITPGPQSGRGDHYSALSPDGSTLCFARLEARESADLFLLPVDVELRPVQGARRLTSRRLRIMFPQWSRGGKEVIYTSGTLGNFAAFRVAVDGRSEPREIVEAGSGIEALAVCPKSGQIAVSRRKSETNIWRLDLDSPGGRVVKVTKLPASTGSEDMVVYAPGGNRIAFESRRSGELQVWISDANGGNPAQLTSYGALDMVSPLWMPGGEALLVTVRSRNLGLRNFIHPVAGGEVQELRDVDGIPCTFSGDGQWLYFSRFQKDVDLFRYSMKTGEVRRVTYGERVSHAMESADGRALYFAKPEAELGLWRWEDSGKRAVRVLPRLARRNLFGVRKEGIYYMDREARSAVIRFVPFAGGKEVELFRMEETPEWGFTIAPDGRTILMTREDLTVSEAVLLGGLA